MKLNKKRISILVSLMCLLVLLVFALCSFDLPDYDYNFSEAYQFSSLSLNDYTALTNIVSYQSQLGQFNSLVPVAYVFTNTGYFYAIFILPRYTYSINLTSSNVYFEGNFVRIAFNEQGFFVYEYIGSSISLSLSYVVSYRSSVDSTFVINDYFTFAPSNSLSSVVSSCSNYWNTYLNNLLFSGASPEEVESIYDSVFDAGYFEGLESGLVWGEELGYQEGYTEGYQEGIGTGYRDGFLAGEAEGYDTGYADGYQDGYDTGYSDGLEDAPPETVTIVIYEEPVEIDVPGIISSVSSIPDSILSGSFDFEFAGINIYGLLKLLIIVFIISAVIFFIIKRSA